MRGLEVAVVFVGEDLVEDAVGVPWGTATDEFAIGCSKSIEYGVVEFLIVGYEVKFIRKNDV